MSENRQQKHGDSQQGNPLLEWIASGIGLVLAVGGIGFLLWNGITADETPPAIEVQAERVLERRSGYTVEIRAINSSPRTAETVVVAGELKRDGQTVETSQTTFQFVPGHSEERGGLYFSRDPRDLQLELRPKGYVKP